MMLVFSKRFVSRIIPAFVCNMAISLIAGTLRFEFTVIHDVAVFATFVAHSLFKTLFCSQNFANNSISCVSNTSKKFSSIKSCDIASVKDFSDF